MMFLRHGMFARKSIVERRRKLIIGGVLGLLLVLSMLIYAIVKAAGSYDLGYVNEQNKGLTNGHITGEITKTDNTQASDVGRDSIVKLNLKFDFTNDMVESAKNADAWTYNLSSVVTDNSFISAVNDITSPIDIVNDGVIIATYTVSNGLITVVPSQSTEAQDWWTSHASNVKVGLSVNLQLDKIGVGVNNSNKFVLPGTTTPEQTSGVSTNEMFYRTPRVAINESVFDEGSQSFRTGNYDQLISVEKENSNYIATYNTNFYTDAYAQDLTVTIALDGDQTFVSGGTFEMTTCISNNCIHNADKTTISIPSQYVTVSADNKTATIDMEGFLYDYCELGGNCTAAGINGYILNDTMSANNANGSDYYIQYKADLGQTNPAGNGKTYSATATVTGNNGALTASSTVKYSDGIVGSKKGTCANGSTVENYVTTCNADDDGNIYIDYVVTVGDSDTDLSNTTIIDRITDNQIIVSDITLAGSGNTTTIALSNVCASSNTGTDCIDPAAIDSNYSTNSQRLFEHAFSSGDTGPWTISYRVKIATDANISGDRVDNIIDLKIGQSTYNNVWQTSTHYDFVQAMSIEKTKDFTRETDGYVHWTIRVYGPATGSALTNVEVKDIFWYDANQYSTGKINISVDTATVTVNNATTSTDNYSTAFDGSGNLVITIPTLGVGEVYSFGIVTAADEEFKAAYPGQAVTLTNRACRVDDNRCSEEVKATILSPNAEEMTKSAQPVGDVFYWQMDEANNKYVYSTRKGFTWSVTINPNAGVVTDAGRGDYAPYFSDIIPQGLYLTYHYNQGPMPEPTCQTTGACDASVDIDQSKFYTVINVRRIIPSASVGQYTDVNNVQVTVNSDGRTEPINLASLFNDESCVISDIKVPSATCAGINNATYIVTYATTIADQIYNDVSTEHTFANQAKLYERIDENTLSERDNAVASVTYRNDTIISKGDATAENLDSANKISYVIAVNEMGYAYYNNGESYEEGVTRPMLTVTDHISEDVNLSGSITCLDGNDLAVSDCEFHYDSETRILTAYIPDGYARRIRYDVVVANPIPGNRSDYTNTAVLRVNEASYESTVTKAHVVNSDAGYIIGNGVMSIKKVNADNFNEIVPGVTFKLVQVDYDAQGNLGAETPIDLNGSAEGTDGVTDDSGIIRFENLCGYSTSTPASPCLNGGQLYYWQEVSAPAPYIPLNGAAKHYFVLYDEALLADDTKANRAVAQRAADIISENGNNTGIEVEVLKSNYEWIVSNTKQIETTLAIEKKITGNTARVEDEFTIQIKATDLAGKPLNGSLTSYVYLQSDREDIEITEPVVFTDGVATIKMDHGRGILIDGLYVGGRYEITELNNTDYTVSYTCTDLDQDGGCDSDTANTGTFVKDISTGRYPTVAEAGQTVVLNNNSSTEITGISDKKPSLAIAIVFGSTVSVLGIVIARRFRH